MLRYVLCSLGILLGAMLVSPAVAQTDSTEAAPPQEGELRVVPLPAAEADGTLLPEELERRLRERLRRLPAEIPAPSSVQGSRTRFLSTPEAARIHFLAADKNEDGRLTVDELERLPKTLRELLEARMRRDPEAGIAVEDVRAALVLLEAENQQRRAAAEPPEQAEPLRANVPQVMQEALQDPAGNPPPKAQATTVQIVLLGRFSEEVPVRTLGAEVLAAIGDSEGEVPSSLVGRLLPWVGAEENSAVKILDAMHGGTVVGDQVRLQTGTQPTGTMATLRASVDGKEVWVKADFEKSFLQQDHRSNWVQAHGAPPGAMPAGYGGMSSYPGMPATSTLQATGTVRVTPGRPVILTEVLQQSESGVQEYVVLVDAAIESD